MPSTPPVGVSPKLPHVRQDASSGAAAIGVGSGGENGAAPKTAGTGEGPALRSGGGARGSGSGGSGGSGILSPAAAARRGAYEALLKRLIEEHKEYPPAARRTRLEGSCLRRFTLGRGGSLRRVESLSSCGHAYLDEAATCAITAVGAFPPLPEEFGGPEATFSVSIKFTLK